MPKWNHRLPLPASSLLHRFRLLDSHTQLACLQATAERNFHTSPKRSCVMSLGWTTPWMIIYWSPSRLVNSCFVVLTTTRAALFWQGQNKDPFFQSSSIAIPNRESMMRLASEHSHDGPCVLFHQIRDKEPRTISLCSLAWNPVGTIMLNSTGTRLVGSPYRLYRSATRHRI
ncbi:hypothetical protein CY34DRAFT_682070 [Suillus luteus UH-Slu-Lm8-n1]|uniref:Uncharacterized protein n=1 Tax=Suillus luteus UH-Slu-Lm8-n1 TaxID=930992 RepID=A0A0D0BBW8_9AGAM|nr:hypothetical protein CY34DRAFT_682070 [Suillus luteus UH-Slu-Lm8-n1]